MPLDIQFISQYMTGRKQSSFFQCIAVLYLHPSPYVLDIFKLIGFLSRPCTSMNVQPLLQYTLLVDFQTMSEPMDLGTVKGELLKGDYSEPVELREDV